MSAWLSLFELPPHPVTGVVLVVVSLIWAIRSRRKRRPNLLAAQVALLASAISQVALTFGQGDASLLSIIGALLQISLGQLFAFWVAALLIIRGVFVLRTRNDNAHIFTRNRK
jgi:uncharacterized membrane protein